MKAVILAGGLGTRISEETDSKPKPMIEIGGRPILWHIMKLYSSHGINDFIICCGYKGYVIKEYFANYFLHMSDVTFNIKDNTMSVHDNKSEPWTVSLIDTGEETMTGGRLKRVKSYLENESGESQALDIAVEALKSPIKKQQHLGVRFAMSRERVAANLAYDKVITQIQEQLGLGKTVAFLFPAFQHILAGADAPTIY